VEGNDTIQVSARLSASVRGQPHYRRSRVQIRPAPSIRSPQYRDRLPDCANISTFFVHNHLHTVHAIASCNAAEMAMGMLMEATVPTSHRWIPKAMNVQYLAKATLGATARVDPPDFAAITEGIELVVPVSVTDRHGVEVVHADITTLVTHANR
jgi:acyl-coenzyme A thioesterase PaaI-like protein